MGSSATTVWDTPLLTPHYGLLRHNHHLTVTSAATDWERFHYHQHHCGIQNDGTIPWSTTIPLEIKGEGGRSKTSQRHQNSLVNQVPRDTEINTPLYRFFSQTITPLAIIWQLAIMWLGILSEDWFPLTGDWHKITNDQSISELWHIDCFVDWDLVHHHMMTRLDWLLLLWTVWTSSDFFFAEMDYDLSVFVARETALFSVCLKRTNDSHSNSARKKVAGAYLHQVWHSRLLSLGHGSSALVSPSEVFHYRLCFLT